MSLLDSLRNKRIAILGFGKEGESLLRFFHRAKVSDLTILDEQETLPNLDPVKRLGAKVILGKNYLDSLQSFDLIFRSPGVPLNLPKLGAVRSKLSSATRLFFELSPTRNIVGVTGTKGKSTTASLIYQILRRKFRRVFLAGNIGLPMLDLLPRLRKDDWVVLELSSFQLEDLTVSPKIAVLLNVTPEHLTRHGDFRRYLFAKSSIFRYQRPKDFLITNYDHFALRSVSGDAPSQIVFISRRTPLTRGVFLKEEGIFSTLQGGQQKVLLLSEIPLIGSHNLENVLPAVACGLILGVAPKRIAEAVRRFKSLPHRLEKVAEKNGVVFVDDSIATTPEASLAGAESFDSPIALIAGGSSKGASFVDWARGLAKTKVVYVALIGEEAPHLEHALRRFAPRIKREKFSTLLQAVRAAHKAVREGGVVLLAPACASFDMFRDYAERGERFKKITLNI